MIVKAIRPVIGFAWKLRELSLHLPIGREMVHPKGDGVSSVDNRSAREVRCAQELQPEKRPSRTEVFAGLVVAQELHGMFTVTLRRPGCAESERAVSFTI